jgi:hypothetical protein
MRLTTFELIAGSTSRAALWCFQKCKQPHEHKEIQTFMPPGNMDGARQMPTFQVVRTTFEHAKSPGRS